LDYLCAFLDQHALHRDLKGCPSRRSGSAAELRQAAMFVLAASRSPALDSASRRRAPPPEPAGSVRVGPRWAFTGTTSSMFSAACDGPNHSVQLWLEALNLKAELVGLHMTEGTEQRGSCANWSKAPSAPNWPAESQGPRQ
jgi:hypothetical protein